MIGSALTHARQVRHEATPRSSPRVCGRCQGREDSGPRPWASAVWAGCCAGVGRGTCGSPAGALDPAPAVLPNQVGDPCSRCRLGSGMRSCPCCGLGLSQKLWRERFGLTRAARVTSWHVLGRMRCATTWRGGPWSRSARSTAREPQADLLEQVCHEVLEVGTGIEFGVRKLHQDHHEQDGLDQPGCPRLQKVRRAASASPWADACPFSAAIRMNSSAWPIM